MKNLVDSGKCSTFALAFGKTVPNTAWKEAKSKSSFRVVRSTRRQTRCMQYETRSRQVPGGPKRRKILSDDYDHLHWTAYRGVAYVETIVLNRNTYLLEIRIKKVTEYLRNTSYSLSEIAELCGFNGASYMAEMFKKSTGVCPLNYRIKNKGLIGQ